LDGVRGVAALAVAVDHLGTFFKPWHFSEGYLSVNVFFVLSGVVLANAYEARLAAGLSPREFAWLRIVRIYPLFLLASVLGAVALLCGVGSGVDARHVGMLLLLAALLIPDPTRPSEGGPFPLDNPAWTLPLELAVNLAYAAWFDRLTAARLRLVLLVSGTALAAMLVLHPHHWLNFGWTTRTLPIAAFRASYSFFAGVLLLRAYRARGRPWIGGGQATAALWLLLGFVTLLLAAAPPPNLRPYFDFVAVTAIIPALIYLGMVIQPEGRSARLCGFVGTLSYAVFVLHLPLGNLTRAFLNGWAGIDEAAYAPWAGLALLLPLLAACWLADTVYDAPLRRRLRAPGGARVARTA
jgi:peptidoglycan/LPS O-acetylase OafA/YrhL